MKKFAILFFASFVLFACKKDNNGTSRVKFVVAGDNVTQFKISTGATEVGKSVPFSGTRDTIIIVPVGTSVKLDTKATSNNLRASIYVDNELMTTATDSDTDGDGKSEVKVEHTVAIK